MARWLLKSEPDVFAYDDLVRAGREGWDGIRSYQARNFLREMQRGEQAIFYHSNAKPPGVAGICKIVKGAEPDPEELGMGLLGDLGSWETIVAPFEHHGPLSEEREAIVLEMLRLARQAAPLLFDDAGPVVLDLQHHRVVLTPNGKADASGDVGRASGVRHQVEQDLPDGLDVQLTIDVALSTFTSGFMSSGLLRYPHQRLP